MKCKYCGKVIVLPYGAVVQIGRYLFCDTVCADSHRAFDEFTNKEIRREQEQKTAKGENDTSPLGAD
jgi:hypothetical protein